MNAFTTRGPITQQRAEEATEWLIHNAKSGAVFKAVKERCEHRLRVVKSLAMKASGEKSAAAQEREAYASAEYQDAIEELYEATVQFETYQATRFAAQEVAQVWRSINANLRGAGV